MRRRIFGMTSGQIVILGVMVLVILVSWGYLALTLLNPSQAESNSGLPTSAQAALAAQATFQKLPTLTPAPIPTSTPIPDWKSLAGGGVEIWLPQSYAGGDVTQNPQDIFDRMIAAGGNPEFNEEFKQALLAQEYLLFAFDTTVDESYFFTTLVLWSEPSEGKPLDSVIDALVLDLETSFGYRVVGRGDISLDNFQAERLIMERRVDIVGTGKRVYRSTVVYIFAQGETIWTVRFLTDRDQVDARLADFDISASTIRLTP